MTKKKAFIYLLIFIVLVGCQRVWKHYYLMDPAKDFPEECKMTIEPSCQLYLNKISKEGKYEEAVKIQKVRINENEKILNFYKSRVFNKFLFYKTAKEVDEELKTCIDRPNCKKDYYLLKASDFTIRDIVIDSLAVSEIELKELKDKNAAIKTLKKARKIVRKNKFFFAKDSAINALDIQIAQLEPVKAEKK